MAGIVLAIDRVSTMSVGSSVPLTAVTTTTFNRIETNVTINDEGHRFKLNLSRGSVEAQRLSVMSKTRTTTLDEKVPYKLKTWQQNNDCYIRDNEEKTYREVCGRRWTFGGPFDLRGRFGDFFRNAKPLPNPQTNPKWLVERLRQSAAERCCRTKLPFVFQGHWDLLSSM